MASLPNRALRRFVAVRTLATVAKIAGLLVFVVLVVMVTEGWRP